MPGRFYRRLTRYTAVSVAQLITASALAVIGIGSETAALIVLVVALPGLWMWGAFQADLVLNPYLDDAARARWRITFACVPGALAMYWRLQVWTRRPAD